MKYVFIFVVVRVVYAGEAIAEEDRSGADNKPESDAVGDSEVQARFSECETQLDFDQKAEFFALQKGDRNRWLDENCKKEQSEPQKEQAENTDDITLPSDLTAAQVAEFQRCREYLSREEIQEFASLPATAGRRRWLSLHCLTDAEVRMYLHCSPSLLEAEKKDFAALTNLNLRRKWLSQLCNSRTMFMECSQNLNQNKTNEFRKTEESKRLSWIRDNCEIGPFDPNLAVDKRVNSVRIRSAFMKCRNRLSPEQQLEFLELPVEKMSPWLSEHCPKAQTVYVEPAVAHGATPQFDYDLPRTAGRPSWMTTRIVAHVLIWPGAISLIGGIVTYGIAKSGDVEDETLAIWIPQFVAGGALMIGGLICTAVFLKKKRELRLSLLPLSNSDGIYWGASLNF